MQINSTINQEEIDKFSGMSSSWWDQDGPMKALHQMNPCRIEYINNQISKYFPEIINNTILDVGCGAGIITEPMKRIGYNITGIDASRQNIEFAIKHSQEKGLDIDYINTSIENYNNKHQIILALEILEHVDNMELFLESCLKNLEENGIMIISTINKTIFSYAMAIVGAEKIMKLVPKGTHEWSKFIKPSIINKIIKEYGFYISDIKGMKYNPIAGTWRLSGDVSVNYIATISRK